MAAPRSEISMIETVVCASSQRESLERVLGWLGVQVEVASDARPGALHVSRADWQSSDLDLLELDNEIHERDLSGEGLCLCLSSSGANPIGFFGQVLTRYQRLLRLSDAPDEAVARVLGPHRALFDLDKPLVRADYAHALDTWRWTLRLDGGASRALQLAALFHDIERLRSEPERRVEHLAPNYQAFKQAHARAGGRLSATILAECALSPAVVQRVQQLVERHETPGDDEELAALNDADALSFFSLNSWGFVHYFGFDHVRTKVTYTLSRMRPAARGYLRQFRYHPRLSALLREHLEPKASRASVDELESEVGR